MTKVLGKMFDAGPEGFQGGLSAKKYMSITQVSKATATRDLQYLYEQGMLTKSGAGRSVRYALNLRLKLIHCPTDTIQGSAMLDNRFRA
jgi:DNA-binding transcriptional ArsR family regulator